MSDSPKSGAAIKAGIAVALLGAAGYFAWSYMNSTGDVEVDVKNLTYFKCADCQQVEALNDAQYLSRRTLTAQAAAKERSEAEGSGKFRAGRAAQSGFVIVCSGCNHISSYPATKCPHDGEVFIDRDRVGTYHTCPKCGFSRKDPNGVVARDHRDE